MSTGVSAGLVRAAASVQLPVQTWTVYLFILLSCTELLLPLPVYSTVYSELIEANTQTTVWKQQQHANTANVRRRRQRFEWRLRSRVFKYLKCRTRISTTVNCTRHSCWCFLKKQQQKKESDLTEGLFLAPPLTAPRDRGRKQTWIYTLLNLWTKPRPNVENRIVYC